MPDTTANAYETRRLEKIKQNQALLAELDIKPLVAKRPLKYESEAKKKPPSKRRKLLSEVAPTRISARIASAPQQPSYNDEPSLKQSSRRTPASNGPTKKSRDYQSPNDNDDGSNTKPKPSSLPKKDIEEIQANWTSWQPTAPPPTRHSTSGNFHFADYPAFQPNKSPIEVLQEGCFGGSYYRPLYSRRLGITVSEDWHELPSDWLSNLSVSRFLTNTVYDPDVNKYKVSCGQSIEEWEANGWIAHEFDVRGWFQWYTRFFRGRRCGDDERQVSRWRKCVGETGRWRRTLLKKYIQLGVRSVFDDDGRDEDAPEVSPVVHQTCHHWAWEVRQDVLDKYWAEASGGAGRKR